MRSSCLALSEPHVTASITRDAESWVLRVWHSLPFDDEKELKVSFTVCTCRQAATAVVKPYNTVLCADSLLEHTVGAVTIDNEALHGGCRRNLDRFS